MRPVARRKPGGPSCVVETSEILAEAVTVRRERGANYAHQGWSPAATATHPLWTHARMTNNNEQSFDEELDDGWTTKRLMLWRLAFDLTIEELEPVPEFEMDVKNALAKPTDFEKFHAFYRVLQIW